MKNNKRQQCAKKVLIILCKSVMIIILGIALGCVRQPQRLSHFELVKGALTRLLARPSGAFVIIEEPRSRKFVQFAGAKDEPLFLDLPSQTLSHEEMTKAKTVFAEVGYIGPETYQTQMYPGGPPAGEQTSFNVEFGTDVDKAAKLAVAVLHRVYGLGEDAKLKLTEE